MSKTPPRKIQNGGHGRLSASAWFFNAIEASLTRLDTDYLDIYYLHREDHNTPLHVTVSAMGDLIRQGKIRYWGLSNYRGWRIAEVIRVAERLGVDKPVISQPLYNIVNRQAEVDELKKGL